MKHRKMQRHYLAALIPLFVALSGPVSAQSITAITAIPQAGNNISSTSVTGCRLPRSVTTVGQL